MKLPNVTQSTVSSSSWYHEIFYEKADPRTRDRWLMGDPLQIICFYSFYVIFIQYILPRYMRDRKPFDLNVQIIALNFLIFSVSVFFVVLGFIPWMFDYSWRCEPMDWTESEYGLKAANACYLFLLSKFIYTLESVFLGLRKNYSYRATYLLIHHASYPFIIWTVANYFPGGHATFAGFANSFIHMLQFGYRLIFVDIYVISPKMYQYRRIVGLWLSILQFVLIFFHTFQLFISNDCGFPLGYAYSVCAYVTFITFLLITMVVPQM